MRVGHQAAHDCGEEEGVCGVEPDDECIGELGADECGEGEGGGGEVGG